MNSLQNIHEIKRYVSLLMPGLGVNKQREICRLVFEISKITGAAPSEILPASQKNFDSAKKYLLKKRYPKTYGKAPVSSYYLPKLEEETDEALASAEFSPDRIFVDAAVKDSALFARAKAAFSSAETVVLEEKRFAGEEKYSLRTRSLYITEEKYDFVKPCPCTSGVAGCGYNLINLGFGCMYECEYCFLQNYQNLNAVVLPANTGDFFKELDGAAFAKGRFDRPRIGTGEFTDSLVFDGITQYSKELVKYFARRQDLTFEFKTKSVNIQNLLEMPAPENIVVGWSVNAEYIIDNVEHNTPPLAARLAGAARVVKHGYKTAFHFDPVIMHEGWRKNYADSIEHIANAVPPESVAWISVGTLRFERGLKRVIERRFPRGFILNEEFTLGFDGKMRYSEEQRKEVYSFLISALQKRFPKTPVYLCMERAGVSVK